MATSLRGPRDLADSLSTDISVHRNGAPARSDAASDRPYVRRYLAARPAIQRAVALACVAAFIVAASALLADAYDSAASDHQFAVDARSRELSTYQALIASRISQATSLAQAVGGFGSGYAAPRYIDHDGSTPAERMQQGNETHWQSFAAGLIDNVPGMQAFEVQPSGIIAHVYPPDPGSIGFDLLNFAPLAEDYRNFAAAGKVTILGPTILVGTNEMGFVTRFPIYLSENRSFATFWGAGVALFQIAQLFDGLRLREIVQPTGYDLLIYTVRRESTVDPATNATIETQLVDDVYLTRSGISRHHVCGGDHGARARVQLPTRHDMFVCLEPRNGIPEESPSVAQIVIALVIGFACAAGVALLLYGVVAVAFARRHQNVPHREREPKLTRHSMVAIKNMAWWRENQDAATLQHALARFEAVVRSAAAKHRCYVAGRVAEGCFLVVAKDTADLLRFGQWTHKNLAEAVGEMTILTRQRASSDPQRDREDAVSDTTTHTSRRFKARKGKFTVAVAAHYGPLEAHYDAAADAVRFAGDAVVPCATAVDAAEPGEFVSTDDLMNLRVEAEGLDLESIVSVPTRDAPNDMTLFILKQSEEAKRDGILSASASATRMPQRGQSRAHTKLGMGGDSGVLTAVSAASGSVLVKRVGLLSVELLIGQSDADVRLAAPRFAAALGRIAEAVAAMHASIIAVTGSRVVIACNALQAASSPPQRALAVEAAVRDAAIGVGELNEFTVITVATCGTASVGQLPTGQVVCVGRCVTRLSKLAELAQELAERSFASADPAVTQHALVDAPMAEQVRQAFELQCLGPRGVLERLALGASPNEIIDPTTVVLETPSLPPLLQNSPKASPAAGPATAPAATISGTFSPGSDPLGSNSSFTPRATARTSARDSLLYSVRRAWPDADKSEHGHGNDDGEWLYKLEKMQRGSRHHTANSAFDKAVDGDPVAACELARDALARHEDEMGGPIVRTSLELLRDTGVCRAPLFSPKAGTASTPKALVVAGSGASRDAPMPAPH